MSHPADLAMVDVAIVMESTYPYLKGGVSAVVHDIVTSNSSLTFGIIHITWDSNAPSKDLYGMPDNIAWVHPIYLSMQEHRDGFMELSPEVLNMSGRERATLTKRLFDALAAIPKGDMAPMWKLFDEGMNPSTRRYPIWALLGAKEFQQQLPKRFPALDMPLSDAFWLMREFFSLTYALLAHEIPKADVYHAHTTGYASLVSAAAARRHHARFLLTEHNLYVRDTVNTLLARNMALKLTGDDWRTFDVTPVQRAWMCWWIEMGRFCYPSASHITYLYPDAVADARALGAPKHDAVFSIVPNGMTISNFEDAYRQRLEALERILAEGLRVWRFAYIARVVPIKGLFEFIDSARILVERGIKNWTLDILGPTDHAQDGYLEKCLSKIEEYGLEDHFVFRGTVNVPAVIGDFDLLVLPSYNEGQPMVVLEAMTAAVPTVGTEVGGMRQLIGDKLVHSTGRSWEACGVLVDPVDIVGGMADALETVITDFEQYESLARNARGRVEDFFQLHEAMALYHHLYRRLQQPRAQQNPAAAAKQKVPMPVVVIPSDPVDPAEPGQTRGVAKVHPRLLMSRPLTRSTQQYYRD
ncbi:GT4 family glycosyltransferase PelF [Winogradskya humida]|uniref:LPS N-acetylglucosaminyltransferase n=1 Tax=Winogradskya humida TaxID=113566 RepID=A0ABQ3ZVJ8_9ACTN|nr:GT4 family glycosyltransferase PelF [Actinoplanes humidus]GIE22609.1 LPS N-acetylglucosaminyltransferase [Actinoplanes humidus]